MKKWQKWLQSIAACAMGIVTFAGCASGGSNSSLSEGESSSVIEEVDDGIYTVTFDPCTDLKTNKILDQEVEKGSTVNKPFLAPIGDNPNNAEVEGWYTDPEYTDKWNFLTDTVESDMTLYAKWIERYMITYYLGEELETKMFSELIKAGETIPEDRISLSDGYKSKGFFLDPDHTQPYDFSQPVTGNMNIYIDRSDEFYFPAKMIAERFTPVAAGGGKGGAEAGTLEYVADESLADGDDSYTKVNFGYVPEDVAADPHINLTSVKVDITSSQKVKIRMKNMGPSESLRFYYVIRHENDDPIYMPYYNEVCTYTYKFPEEQRNMTADDEWLELVLDFAGGTPDHSGIVNGESLWGNASYLNQLRIQSTCSTPDKNNLNNEFWIQSIEGVKDDTYVGTSNTPEVQNLLKADDAAEVQKAADAQSDVVGWVFPKDNKDVNGTVDFYDKTNGLMAAAEYRAVGKKIILSVSNLGKDDDGKTQYEDISLDDMTLLKFRLRNYGYATSFKVKYYNMKGRSSEMEVKISSRDSEVKEYTLNMFGATNWTGMLKSIEITYDSVGIDNAILFESVSFGEYVPVEFPGFNFDDKHCFGATSIENVINVEYNQVQRGTTINVIDAANAVIQRTYTGLYTNKGYKYMTLNYASVEGITAVNVALTVDGEETTYEFPVSAEDIKPVSVLLTKHGNVQKVKITFVGTGEIVINNVRFETGAGDAMDFSKKGTVDMLVSDWGLCANYDSSTNSTIYTQEGTPAVIKYYYGYAFDKLGKGDGNISLEGKSKIVVVYQNTGAATALNVAIGVTPKTEDDSWKKVHTETDTVGGGALAYQMLQGNMGTNEWACAEYDLFSGSRNGDKTMNAENVAEYALTIFMMQFTNPNYNGSIKIRSIAII